MKMDRSYEIEALYIEGYKPVTIAVKLNIPIDEVYAWIESVDLEWNVAFESTDPYDTINS
jgi:uncharacterized protein YjcR